TAVNIKGEGYKDSWIDTYWDTKSESWKPNGTRFAAYNGAYFSGSSATTNHLAMFDAVGVKWKGCVEARPAPYNLTDAAPSAHAPDTQFVPYFAPDNPGKNATSPNSGTGWNNSYLRDSFGSKDASKVNVASRYYNVASEDQTISENSSRSTGPNYACPTPILPLRSEEHTSEL